MTAPRYGGGESLLQRKGRVESKAGASARVQSGHDPGPGHVRRGSRRREKGETGAAVRRPKRE